GMSSGALGQVRLVTREGRNDAVQLEDRLGAARRELEALRGRRIDVADLQVALASFDPLWDHLTSRERARVVQLLIERIDYDGGTGKIGITFAPAGVQTLAAEAQS